MYKLLMSTLFVLMLISGIAQRKQVDSLLQLLNTQQADSSKAKIYSRLGKNYLYNNNAIALTYFEKALEISKKLNQPLAVGNSYYSIGYCYLQKGDFAKSLQSYLQSASIYEKLKDSAKLANAFMSIANVYDYTNDFKKIMQFEDKAQALIEGLKDSTLLSDLYGQQGTFYDHEQRYDSALLYYKKGYQLALDLKDMYGIISSFSNIGLTYKHQHNTVQALLYFDSALLKAQQAGADQEYFAVIYNNIAATHAQAGNFAAAKDNFGKSIAIATQAGSANVILENYRNLADMYSATKDYEQQAFYLKKYYSLKDSLYTSDTKNQLTELEADYRIGQKNSELLQQQEEVQKQQNERNFFLVIALMAAMLLAASVFFYNRIKKANALLVEKNNQINRQKDELQHTLTNLKNTQTQLVHSEKMASLGELTAGIAHEIQNPLNFVNNFSELNKELIEELRSEKSKVRSERDETLEDEILNDIKQNLEKINQHGKRAESIVKGMLQHSRMSTGKKELTEINKLTDEFLRLSYHGLRAKDKNFNADFTAAFDESIGKIDIIPQDISRVLLNLFNNAFYAVNEKKKSVADDYQPSITVQTKKLHDKVEIVITDNGNGIPQNIIDKIFQPFFTTKPTGQGTGLGLSLSYDIIKAHGGEIKVESKEGEGSMFSIHLPIT